MRAASIGLASLALLVSPAVVAQPPAPQPVPAQPTQPSAPPVEDFKPAPSNQPGKHYPQVNSERRARFRVVAPDAKSVKVPEGAG